MKIIYMGTPEFAIPPLRMLISENYEVVAVVTAPDKPAGRGKKVKSSPVKIFAEDNHIPVLQPVKLKDPEFIRQMKAFNADLQVVVAFRMLPEIIWDMPRLGTFNLHASLLPDYRGAAPINHAVMNGEEVTGLTTFFIDKEIDTGKIIFRQEVPVGEKETAGDLHDKMMEVGAELVLKTVQAVEKGSISPVPQDELISDPEKIKPAPKIFKEDCLIKWNRSSKEIYNFIRGLSPYPGAFGKLQSDDGTTYDMKIFSAGYEELPQSHSPGTVITNGRDQLSVATANGIINIYELQMPGRKRMDTGSFLRGNKEMDRFRFV